MEISDIKDERSLEKWLADKPVEWAQAIAARAALRVAPVVFELAGQKIKGLSERQCLSLILLTFRANQIALAVCKYPLRDMSLAAYIAGIAVARSANATNRVDYAANAAYSAARSANAARAINIAHAANVAARSVATAARSANATEIWSNIRIDCEVLEQTGGNEIMNVRHLIVRRLWLDYDGSNGPISIVMKYRDFLETKIAHNTTFRLIAHWYQAALKGQSAFGEEADVQLAQQPNEFWEGDPIEVMDRVAELVGWERDAQLSISEFIVATFKEKDRPLSIDDFVMFFSEAGYKTSRDSIRGRLVELTDQQKIQRISNGLYAPFDYIEANGSIDVPPLQPASMQPDWEDGKLKLPDNALSDDLRVADITAALKGLKHAMSGFLEEAKTLGNIDARFISYFETLLLKLPDAPPPQDELFAIAHNENILDQYVVTAQREWPELAAAQLGALSLQFSRTMEKFPEWREFKEKPSPEITSDNIEDTQKLTEFLVEQLESELSRDFIDAEIPEALQDLSTQVQNSIEDHPDAERINGSTKNKVRDLLESTSNLFKRITEAALWIAGTGGKITQRVFEPFARSLPKSYDKYAEKFTDDMMKWAFRTLKVTIVGGGAGVGSMSLATWLSKQFPETFSWLGKLWPLISSLF